jgi:hypothetical protein
MPGPARAVRNLVTMVDRVLGAFHSIARGAIPDLDYKGTFPAMLLKQHSNRRRVDVAPVDPRLPRMVDIPLKVGVPGVEVVISPGHLVLVGWENGRPDRPYATLWDPGTNGTERITFHADKIELGGTNLQPLMDGVVLGRAPCQFTGAPHHVTGGTSLVVLAKP